MSRKRSLPPFIRPEPIIMTSPQGSIHFDYHPLSSVCVRRPGKQFYMLRKVTHTACEIFWGHLCDSLWKLGHIYISERFGGTLGQVVLVKPCRSAQHLLKAQHLWGDCVCMWVHILYISLCVCQCDYNFSQWHQRNVGGLKNPLHFWMYSVYSLDKVRRHCLITVSLSERSPLSVSYTAILQSSMP